MTETKPEREDYTVGWICALDKELTACRFMFDQTYDDVEIPNSSDHNSYCLGKVGPHNVVAACLPEGSYGTTSAATVAKDLLASFPNIRFGVLVGIGGGAPSQKHDMRLGDVVVSQPEGTLGGVIQYDLGQQTVDGFKRKGQLNRPPDELLTSLNKLKSNFDYGSSDLSTHLQKLPPKWQRPQAPDRLFDPQYKHAAATCDGCDQSMLLLREKRESEGPEIHYGTIASGNSVIKDAQLRDELRAKYDVLCFEMEAAGLMNNFPCMVVRGVCDYSDSHKNDNWHRYAAITAAAWAKELLRTVKPTAVNSMPKALKLGLGELMAKVTHMWDSAQKKNIEKWLSAPDPSTNYALAREKRQPNSGVHLLRSPQFEQWKSSQECKMLWLHGKAGSGKTLLSASVLEHLEQSVHDEDSAIVYFFFNTQDQAKTSHAKMIRSLAAQLYSKDKEAWDELSNLYQAHDQGKSQPMEIEIQTLVENSLKRFKRVWILLDALDECEIHSRQAVLKWLKSLLTLGMSSVRLVATSRNEVDIQDAIEQIAVPKEMLPIDGDIISPEIRAYVHRRLFEEPDFERWRGQEILNEIERKVTEKVDGMFLWAACLLDDLQMCVDLGTLQKELSRLPKTLNETYDRMMQRIEDIHQRRAMFLMQLMLSSERPLTLVEAVDALATDSEAGLFDINQRMPRPMDIGLICPNLITVNRILEPVKKESKERRPHADDGTCAEECEECARIAQQNAADSNKDHSEQHDEDVDEGYVEGHDEETDHKTVEKSKEVDENQTEVDDEKSNQGSNGEVEKEVKSTEDAENFVDKFEVVFAHSSVKEYLLSEKTVAGMSMQFTVINMRKSVVKTCLVYVMHLHSVGDTAKVSLARPWARHSSEHWFRYAREAESSDPSLTPMLSRLFTSAEIFKTWLAVYNPDYPDGTGVDWFAREGSPLYYAALGGITSLVDRLSCDLDVNAVGGRYHDALQAACVQGHTEIAQLLINRGANVNAYDGMPKAQGRWGVWKKVTTIATSKGKVFFANNYGTALQAASFKGHMRIVQMLLHNKADVNLHFGGYGSALISAAIGGHKEIVELLIKNGAKVSPAKVSHTGALLPMLDAILANASEYTDGAFKTDNIPIIDAPTCLTEFASPLQGAAYYGRKDVVDVLLARGAADNEDSMKLALQGAVMKGYNEVATTLLKKGGSSIVEQISGLAVMSATTLGREDILETLLQYSGDQQNRIMKLILDRAAQDGHISTVKLVLEKGGKKLASQGGNAFMYASESGHKDVLELLFEYGYAPDAQIMKNSLKRATENGYQDIVQMLLMKSAKTLSPRAGDDALIEASGRGHKAILELLFENGFFPNEQTMGPALSRATAAGHVEPVRMLLARGDKSLTPSVSGAAVKEAVVNGQKEILAMIFENGAIPDGDSMKNALVSAVKSEKMDLDIVRMLLEHSDKEYKHLKYGDVLKATAEKGNTELLKMLLENGVDANSPCEEGSLLQVAANADVVSILVQNGYQIDVEADEDGNALRQAVKEGHKETTQSLLKAGANVNAQSRMSRMTPLAEAAAAGHKEIASLLLNHSANPNKTNIRNGSPLIAASMNGYIDVVQLLLAHGADVNKATEIHGNAVRAAAQGGHKNIVEFLLAQGADPNVAAFGKGNAYQSALKYEQHDILPLLEKATDPAQMEVVDGMRIKDLWRPGKQVAGKLWKPGRDAVLKSGKQAVAKTFWKKKK